MQVSLETKDGLERIIKVTVPAEEVVKHYDKKLNALKGKAKIDGFRPGKVPLSVVEERYGQSVHYETVNELIRETLFKAIEEQKLNPAGMPEVNEVKAEPKAELAYEATFEVYPEVTVKDFGGAEIEKTLSDIADSDIDDAVDRLRKQHAEWTDVDRAAKIDDQVTIDFDGYVDGEAIQGGKAEGVPLLLGSKSMIPGFEDGIVGMKAGDERDIKTTFPEKYHDEKMAGKKADFNIKLHKVSESTLPELNDELIEKLGIKEGGVEKLRENLRKHMNTELESAIKLRNKNAVLEKLLEINEIILPKALIETEMKNMYQQTMQMQGQKMEGAPELNDAIREALKLPAEKRVKLGLLIAEVIKTNEIKADNDRVKTLIENMAGSYDNPAEFVQWYYSDKNRVAQIEAVALEDQVVDKLLETAKVKETTMKYEDVINPAS